MLKYRKMYLQSNFVDRSFQNALLPVNLLQHTSFLSKYTIRNSFIYPQRFAYYIMSFFFICVTMYSHYYHSRIGEMVQVPLKRFDAVAFSLFFHVISFSGESILLFIVNICSSEYEVQLVLIIQKITTFFRISNNFRVWKRGNWAYVVVTYFIYVSLAFAFASSSEIDFSSSGMRFSYAFVLLSYDVSIICAFRYIKLCDECLRLWIYNVQLYSKQFHCYEAEIDKRYADSYIRGLLNAYVNILDSFGLIKHIFQLPVCIKLVDIEN